MCRLCATISIYLYVYMCMYIQRVPEREREREREERELAIQPRQKRVWQTRCRLQTQRPLPWIPREALAKMCRV